MKKIIIILCVVFLKSVKSECDNIKSAEDLVEDILKERSAVENLDLKLEVPKFEQIKNVGIEDLNEILQRLTNWFEIRLNDTDFILKHVNNKTRIFVKSFDFNVDFDNGKAKMDVNLTDEAEDKSNEDRKVTVNDQSSEELLTTTIEKDETVTEKTKNVTIDSRNKNIENVINKLDYMKNNEVLKFEGLDPLYYDDIDDNSTDYPIIDYIDMYKDTTNEERIYTSTEISTIVDDIITEIYEHNSTENSTNRNGNEPDPICKGDKSCMEFVTTAYPWIVSVFITNETKGSQFSYYCDGALLSDKVIITDARCVYINNRTWEPVNVLVFLGKNNLQQFGEGEKVQKIKDIIIHPNFTVNGEGKAVNDLALLVMEDPVEFGDNIQSACLHQDDMVEEAATTAWALNGALLPVMFNKDKSEMCYDRDQDIFCATYGNEVALCPSYGGMYVSKQMDKWCIQGIFYGDPADRGICFTKDVLYTSLKNYNQWIVENVELYRNGIL